MPFGDLLRPVFSATGELKGVHFDCRLISLMFKAHSFRPLVLQRAIKACAYINRLLADGQAGDYLLKEAESSSLTEKAAKTVHVSI